MVLCNGSQIPICTESETFVQETSSYGAVVAQQIANLLVLSSILSASCYFFAPSSSSSRASFFFFMTFGF